MNTQTLMPDKSLKAYSDGSFYDFGRGGKYYPDKKSLESKRPDLKDYSPTQVANNISSLQERRKSVTQQFQEARLLSPLARHLAHEYVPFFNFDKCQSNIGVIHGKLAVAFWTPTIYGAARGTHYSFAQYRADIENAKWMSVPGSDSKSFEIRVLNHRPVFAVFGMGDFLVIKSTSLNFIAFGGDGSIKNNHYAEIIKTKIGKRLILVIGDNDDSGQSTIDGFLKLRLNAKLFKWPKSTPLKADLRDLSTLIQQQGGDIDDLEQYLYSKASA
jgi:predicted phosphodiesterase